MADPKIRYDIAANVTGAAEAEKLAAELAKLDDAVDPALAQKARDAAAALRSISQQQAAIEEFRRWKTATTETAAELARLQVETQQLAAQMAASGAPTRAQSGEMERLRDAVKSTKAELQAQTASLDAARAGLTQFGVPLGSVAAAQAGLNKSARETQQQLAALSATARDAAGFGQLVRGVDAARTAMQSADSAVTAYDRAITQAGAPTRAQAAELERLRAAAAQTRAAFEAQQSAVVAQATALRQAGVNTEALTAQARGLVAAEQAAGAAAQAFGGAAAAGAAKAKAANDGVRESVDGIGSTLRTLQGVAGTVLGGQLLGGTVGDVLKTADAYDNLAARVRLVTGEGTQFDQAFQGVQRTALATNSSLDSTGTLFTRIAQAGKEIGLSQQQALSLTETINQAVQLSGGSAASADAAITQLIQGLQSGVLRGEEFNSVMEQAPRLAQALAAGLGVTTGQLRTLAGEGQLTTTTVIQALQKQREAVASEFGALPATVGRAITNLQTQWTVFVGTLNQGTGTTSVVADGINLLANNLQTVADVAGRAGAVLTAALAVQGVQALQAFVAEGRAAAMVSTALSASLGSIPKVISITVAAAGFEIGFQLGEMLRDNSALARQLGVAIAGFFQSTVSDLQLVAEAAGAIFSSDTIGAAFERYKQRAAQLDESFTALWEDAKNAPGQAAAAADQAGTALQTLGGSAQVMAGQVGAAGGAAAGSVGSVGTQAAAAATSLQSLGATGQGAGTQIGAAGTSAAGSVSNIGTAANTATGALLALGRAAGISLPGVNVTAQQVAAKLAEVATQGGSASAVLESQLPAAIAGLSGPELAQVGAALNGSLNQVIGNSQRLAAEMEAGGQSGEAALSRADLAARLLQKSMADVGVRAAESLGVDMAPLGTTLSAPFVKAQTDLSTLIGSLPSLQSAGIDTGAAVSQALGRMINGAQNQAEIDAVISRINALGTAGTLAGPQLSGVMQGASDKAVELRTKMEEATPGIQSIGEAARLAGVDAAQLTTGISSGVSQGLTRIDALAQQIAATGTSAQLAGPVLAQALDQQLAAAKTTTEADAIRSRIEGIIAKSPELGASLSGALEAARQKGSELSPQMKQLQADAELLGIKLSAGPAGAVNSTNALIAAYERTKVNVKASADDIDAAFVNMANKAIAAAGGIVPDWIKAEAQLRNVQVNADGCTYSLSGAGAAGAAAGRQIAAGMQQASAAGLALIDTMSAVRDRNKQVTDEVAAADAARHAMNRQAADNTGLDSLDRKRRAGTLSGADLATAQAAADAARVNSEVMLSNVSAYDLSGIRSVQNEALRAQQILEQVQQLAAMDKAGGPAGRAARQTAQPAPAAASTAPAAGGRTVTVKLDFGGTTSTVRTDEEGANALLQVLEAAKRATGG